MSENPIVNVEATDIPGLFDVLLDDGRVLTDLTVGQVWSLIPVNPPSSYPSGRE